jgi:hypothetical protein
MTRESPKEVFDYRPPPPRARLRLPILLIVVVTLPIVVPATIWTAARIAQRVLGREVLYPSDSPLAFIVLCFPIWEEISP